MEFLEAWNSGTPAPNWEISLLLWRKWILERTENSKKASENPHAVRLRSLTFLQLLRSKHAGNPALPITRDDDKTPRRSGLKKEATWWGWLRLLLLLHFSLIFLSIFIYLKIDSFSPLIIATYIYSLSYLIHQIHSFLLILHYISAFLTKSTPLTPVFGRVFSHLTMSSWPCWYMTPSEKAEDELQVTQSWGQYCLCTTARSFGFLKSGSSFSSFFQRLIYWLKRTILINVSCFSYIQ